MRIELTEENRGSFWEDSHGTRLQVVGWSDERLGWIVMRDASGNVFATVNIFLTSFRRLEGCDSFDWVEETFPQYRAVYNPEYSPKLAYHRRDSETDTVTIYKDETDRRWYRPWCKSDEDLHPLITEEEAKALLDPKPAEEVDVINLPIDPKFLLYRSNAATGMVFTGKITDCEPPKLERIPVTLWAHKAILEGMQPTIFASAVELKSSTKDFHVEIHSDNAGGWYVNSAIDNPRTV